MNAAHIEDIYELSPMQQGLLFHTIADPNSGVYFEQLSIKLQGNLNTAAFQKAWQTLVNRHPILRTAFYWEELEQPYQVVFRQVELAIAQQDWRGLSTQAQEQQLEFFLKSDREQGFDLSQTPLLRLALLQISDDAYYFVRSHHHIILEGWSWSLLWNEINSLYHAFCQEKILNLPPARPYRDYITWLQQQDLSKAEAFWRQQLQGFTAPTPLVVDRITNHALPNQAGEDIWQHLDLSATTTATLQSFARQHQLTLNVLLQGAFALLLSRYSGETDIVFGITTSGRPAELAGVESIVGLFLNTLPLRLQVVSDAFIVPWLQQLQAQLALISQYEYTPLLEIQKWSEVPRGLPLFESILVFNNYPVDAGRSQLSESIGASNYRSFEKTNYPLALVIKPGQQLRLEITYDPCRFEESAISRLLGHLKTLLESIPANSAGQLRDLPLLTAPEQQQLLVEWNNTQQDYPQFCIHQLFEAQVEQSPDAIAVIFADQQLTYRQLNQQANQLANYLQRLGVQPNDLVGICVERSLSMLVGLLGILKAGGAYVPLDPAYPQERLMFMLEDAKVSLLVTDQSFFIGDDELRTKILHLGSLQETIAQESKENPYSQVNSDNLAYVIYTSGSTGKPKGVLIPHYALTNCLAGFRQKLGLSSGDTFLSVTTLSFDIAALELYLPLILGDRLILASREVATDGTQLLKLLQSSGATVMQATPATWYILLAAGWDGKQSLKILCGGEALSRELANQLLERCDALWNVYGPTETTIWSAACQVKSPTGSLSIGRPIANTQFYILDQHLQPVPIGVAGELYIGGSGLACGYLNRPELTAERFIDTPFLNSYELEENSLIQKSKIKNQKSKLYRTGDLVRYLSDGNLEYLGRIDHQIKLRGFRIELGEIEAVLSQHPAVQQVVVVAQKDEFGGKRLVAYVVKEHPDSPASLPISFGEKPGLGGSDPQNPHWGTIASLKPPPNKRIIDSSLRDFLEGKLPQYMVPSAFVILEALPLTPNGKVDRKMLSAPDFTQLQLEEDATIPLTPIQEILAGIWKQVLGIEQISINENFFELGGHSLLATRVISQIRSAFKVELPLRSLFEFPTIFKLAQQIETATKAGLGLASPPIKRVVQGGDFPLSFAQSRLWFIDQLELGNSSYNLFVTIRFMGAINLVVLEQSLNEVVRRHEILRTNFIEVNGKPVQVISPTLILTIPVINIQHSLEQEQQIQQLAIAEAKKPFNLNNDPLLRVSFWQIDPTDGVLLLTMHHIISDGWSMGVLLQEITTLYQAFSLQQPSPLPELSIQYADFAVWQRQWLQGEVLQTQLDYWQQQLGHNLPILKLPTDRPRPSVQMFQGARKTLILSQQLSKGLKDLSASLGGTLFMTLLAVFQILLHYLSGQDNIVVGTDVANRNRAEAEALIGFFVNQLVLRTNVSGNPSFRDLLARIRQVTLDAYAHQDLPFDKLVEALNPERDLSRTPLFQVKFVLQNAPMPSLEFGGLTLQPLDIDRGTSRFDLLLNMTEMETGLVGSLEYNTDLFNATTMARFLGHFETLLNYVMSNPDIKLNALKEILALADEQQRNRKEEVYQESVKQKLMQVKRKSVMDKS